MFRDGLSLNYFQLVSWLHDLKLVFEFQIEFSKLMHHYNHFIFCQLGLLPIFRSQRETWRKLEGGVQAMFPPPRRSPVKFWILLAPLWKEVIHCLRWRLKSRWWILSRKWLLRCPYQRRWEWHMLASSANYINNISIEGLSLYELFMVFLFCTKMRLQICTWARATNFCI